MPVSSQTSSGLRAKGRVAAIEAEFFGIVAIIRLSPVIPVDTISATYFSIVHNFAPDSFQNNAATAAIPFALAGF